MGNYNVLWTFNKQKHFTYDVPCWELGWVFEAVSYCSVGEGKVVRAAQRHIFMRFVVTNSLFCCLPSLFHLNTYYIYTMTGCSPRPPPGMISCIHQWSASTPCTVSLLGQPCSPSHLFLHYPTAPKFMHSTALYGLPSRQDVQGIWPCPQWAHSWLWDIKQGTSPYSPKQCEIKYTNQS